MINRTPISTLPQHDGTEVLVAGFVSVIRVLKRMIFVVVQDRDGSVQVAIARGEGSSTLESTALALTLGSAVTVRGLVAINPSVKLGGIELVASEVDIVGAAEPELPVQEVSAPELQLDWRYLALRRPRNLLIFEVQTTVLHAMRSYWRDNGFLELQSPKLMESASESGAETFSTAYFELGRAYLAQSPQFYKQMAMAAGFDRVFEIGPVFRAEPSLTPRHATEFTSVDAELSWIDSPEDVMHMQQRWLRHVVESVRTEHAPAIERHFGVELRVPALPFPALTMADAHAFLRDVGHVIPAVTKAGDIDPDGERLLARRMLEERGHEFFFLTEYPVSLRPFYHMRDAHRPSVTRSFDLLWKGTEIATGAQREHRYDHLARQADEAGLGASVAYYLDFFRYGCPPHGGFGLGLARVLMLLLGLPNIREAVLLHRSPNRLRP
jgi:aspartyl/asparaginyl-tRNA synthetase